MTDKDFGRLKSNLQTMKNSLDEPDSVAGSTLNIFSENLIEETQQLLDELFAEVRKSKTKE